MTPKEEEILEGKAIVMLGYEFSPGERVWVKVQNRRGRGTKSRWLPGVVLNGMRTAWTMTEAATLYNVKVFYHKRVRTDHYHPTDLVPRSMERRRG